ncbi:UNVERIFIED_CONTAM: hypothetical protein BEN50_19805 [Euhalothece sp. KZN 001]
MILCQLNDVQEVCFYWLARSRFATVQIVQEIMRWDMAVLRESPWYQQILQEGEQIGERQGEAKLVLRLLNRRFGVLNPTLEQQIQELSVEQLETLAEELLDFSTVEELETWLEQQ